MEMLNRVEFDYGSLAEAFPEVDPLVEPCGDNVLVQIRSPKRTTKGGIHLVTDVRDTEFWATQVAKVLALGPVAYRYHDTLEYWPEGPWCNVGDFVRIPKHGGDRCPNYPSEGDARYVLETDAGDLTIRLGDFALGGIGTATFGAILVYHLLGAGPRQDHERGSRADRSPPGEMTPASVSDRRAALRADAMGKP